ncbi:TPM domain-containing protein [Patescibacteria group bacterium]|nr:TPM domain-containing protein [Patescibacteria group bacterium]
MKRLIAAILLFFPLIANAYVSPGNAQGFVNDFAGVLSDSSREELEALLVDYQKQTNNEISVVIINFLGDETIETFAVRLFEEWGIGQKGKDTGALFLISIADNKMRIETGYGLEGDLTDIESKRIVSDVVPPYFRSEDWDEGVRAGVVGMISAIGGDYSPSPEVARDPNARNQSEFHIQDYFWFLIFIFIWSGSIFARSRSWWAGGVVGLVAGVVVGLASGAWLWLPAFIIFGLVFDYFVSTKYRKTFMRGDHMSMAWPLLFLMGGRPGRRWDKPGGFGGFGGGLSGGGGASGKW